MQKRRKDSSCVFPAAAFNAAVAGLDIHTVRERDANGVRVGTRARYVDTSLEHDVSARFVEDEISLHVMLEGGHLPQNRK